MRKALWFVRESWHFLGCDGGSGRHRARLAYLTGIPGALVRFLWLSRHDGRPSNG